MIATLGKISNCILSAFAGLSSFLLTLGAFLLLSRIDYQIAASLVIGLFALLVVWVAAERPNGAQARAIAALIDRLLAVGRGDLTSPAPATLRAEMPALAAAVDGLFDQVRSNLDNANAMAMYDPVTALPNRVYFKREADRVLKARERDDRTALLFIDLDGFKEVNDRLGHAQGDQMLVMVANRLRVVVKAETEPGTRTPPLLARLAGDEFTVLLPGVGSREEAERIAHRALAALSEPFRIGDHTPYLGASIGVALCPDHGEELVPLMKAADIAMYHAKACGRSRSCVYDPSLAAASEQRAKSEAALRRVVEEGRLRLAYQPRLCLRSGAVIAGQASVLWDRCDGEAGDLARTAEECGLTLTIGDWAMDAAGEALARWRSARVGQRLCLRVEPRHLQRIDLFARLREALARSGPPPWHFELELPEEALAGCDRRIVGELEALRRDGLSIAVGGFGSGGASVARLSELPVETVRLDPVVTARVDQCDRARIVAAALVHLAHGLGCKTVASSVERQEQLEVLRAVGCDSVQDCFSAAPMAEAAFIEWATSQNGETSLARAS